MAKHVEFDELNGLEVATQLASSGGGKSLTVITTIGDYTSVRYSVVSLSKNYSGTFEFFAKALEAYNDL